MKMDGGLGWSRWCVCLVIGVECFLGDCGGDNGGGVFCLSLLGDGVK